MNTTKLNEAIQTVIENLQLIKLETLAGRPNLPGDWISEILIAADLCEQQGFSIAARTLRNVDSWQLVITEILAQEYGDYSVTVDSHQPTMSTLMFVIDEKQEQFKQNGLDRRELAMLSKKAKVKEIAELVLYRMEIVPWQPFPPDNHVMDYVITHAPASLSDV